MELDHNLYTLGYWYVSVSLHVYLTSPQLNARLDLSHWDQTKIIHLVWSPMPQQALILKPANHKNKIKHFSISKMTMYAFNNTLTF